MFLNLVEMLLGKNWRPGRRVVAYINKDTVIYIFSLANGYGECFEKIIGVFMLLDEGGLLNICFQSVWKFC